MDMEDNYTATVKYIVSIKNTAMSNYGINIGIKTENNNQIQDQIIELICAFFSTDDFRLKIEVIYTIKIS